MQNVMKNANFEMLSLERVGLPFISSPNDIILKALTEAYIYIFYVLRHRPIYCSAVLKLISFNILSQAPRFENPIAYQTFKVNYLFALKSAQPWKVQFKVDVPWYGT